MLTFAESTKVHLQYVVPLILCVANLMKNRLYNDNKLARKYVNIHVRENLAVHLDVRMTLVIQIASTKLFQVHSIRKLFRVHNSVSSTN